MKIVSRLGDLAFVSP